MPAGLKMTLMPRLHPIQICPSLSSAMQFTLEVSILAAVFMFTFVIWSSLGVEIVPLSFKTMMVLLRGSTIHLYPLLSTRILPNAVELPDT